MKPVLTLIVLLLVASSLASAQLGTYALSFNGSSSFVTAYDNSMDVSGNFTLECWVKFAGVSGEQIILAKTEDWYTQHSSVWEFGLWKRAGGAENDKLWFLVGSSTPWAWQYIQSTTTVSPGVWYHIAAVMNGSTMNLYINSTLEATDAFLQPRRSDLDGPVVLGMNPEFAGGSTSTAYGFNGVMDDIRIWGTARTQGQIQAQMFTEQIGDEVGLQAYYKLNEGSGAFLFDDQSSHINGGDLFDVSWVPAGPLPVTMVSFKGIYANAQASLQWSTASEVNNYGFDVERRDGPAAVWTKVGFVAGSGTTIEAHSYSFADAAVVSGQFAYRLKQIDLDGTVHFSDPIMVDVPAGVTGVASREAVPLTTTLAQNYPNPFNPSTMIEFTVAKSGLAKLTVYDLLGREVAVLADGEVMSGMRHRVQFDASRLTSGMYFYRLTAGEAVVVHSLILTK